MFKFSKKERNTKKGWKKENRNETNEPGTSAENKEKQKPS
jgi:hypothetical protein